MNEGKGLLGNILVLDLADEKGSFCSKLLADLGATVIKIEFPEGSRERRIGPFYGSKPGERTSLFFAYHNANKLSVGLDPRTHDGKRIFHHLIEKADVLIETFPSIRFAELDLRPQRLRRANPGLIHLSITGFGRSGPRHHFHFSDRVGSAAGGQMYLSGFPAGLPVKLPGPQSCYTACIYGAVAVLLNLRRRKITGEGGYFDLSIQEAVASTLDGAIADYFQEKRIAERQGNHYGGRSFSLLRCKDGFFQISILRDWETLLELMASQGKAADLTQPQWQRRDYREAHYDHIFHVVERWAGGWTQKQLFELGQAMRFPWAPVASHREVIGSPQLKARRFFVRTRLPGTRFRILAPGLPYRFSSFIPRPPKPAPLLGEHTAQVLKNLICAGTARMSAAPIPDFLFPTGKYSRA